MQRHALLEGRDEEFEATLDVSWTPLNYGRARAWLHCLSCQARCAIVYVVIDDRFIGCRRCANLDYRSRYDAPGARARRAAAIRLRLGGQPQGRRTPPRPKHMHHATYDRVVQELRSLEGR
jgi:hypothetical protein